MMERGAKFMTYLINPSVFYWVSVLSTLKDVMVACIIFGCIVATISWVSYCMYKDLEEEGYLRGPRIISVIIIIIGIFGAVFIPSKETMITILVAKAATVENIGWTFDTLKEAVDYIVKAIAEIKG